MSQTVSAVVTDYMLDTQPGLAKVLVADDGTDKTRYLHAPNGIHAAEDDLGNWEFYLHDGLGSVRQIVGGATYDYDPYGDPSSAVTGFGYTGEWTDANGLNYRRARYYDPELGVWLSEDPLELGNRYAYVDGNPVNFFDSSGLFAFDSCGLPLFLPLRLQTNAGQFWRSFR